MRQQTKGVIFVLTAGCLWGTIGLFVHLLSSAGASTGTMVFLRLTMGTVTIFPMLLLSGGRSLLRIDRKGLALCAVMGLLSEAIFNYAYTGAIARVGVATGAVLLYTSPIFVCVMSRILFQEKIHRQKVIGLIINIVGCTLTVTGGSFAVMGFSLSGVAMGVLAGFLYSLLTIFGVLAKDYASITITFYSFICGSVFMAVAAHPWQEIAAIASPMFFFIALCYGGIATAGAYMFYLKGLTFDLEPSKVPVIASVETIVAAIIGILLLQEPGGMGKLAGIALVLASIAVMNLQRSKKPADESKEKST